MQSAGSVSLVWSALSANHRQHSIWSDATYYCIRLRADLAIRDLSLIAARFQARGGPEASFGGRF